jgi:hypothetical protein
VAVIGKQAFAFIFSFFAVTFEANSNLRAVGDSPFAGCSCTGRVKFPATFVSIKQKSKK